MSKWIPDPNRVIKSPLKVRFEGVPAGSTLAYHLGQTFTGQINHFLRSRTQNQRLSERDVFKVHGGYPGLRMIYSNIHGQETLNIQVSAELVEKVLKEITEDYWTWALIELYVPDTSTATLNGAVAKSYRRVPSPNEVDLKFEGYAYSDGKEFEGEFDWSDGLDPFAISYASTEDADNNLPDDGNNQQILSLLVDMRRAPKSMFTIDIFAYLSQIPIFGTEVVGYERLTPFHRVLFFETDDVWTFPLNNLAFVNHGFEVSPFDTTFSPMISYTNPAAYVPANNAVLAPAPEMVELTPIPGSIGCVIDVVYHSPSGLVQSFTEYAGDHTVPDTVQHIQGFHTSFDIGERTGVVAHFGPQEDRVAKVRAMGGPDWQTRTRTKWDADIDYARWDIDPMIEIGETTISTNNTLNDPDAYRFVGTATIDPVHKVITFKSAT